MLQFLVKGKTKKKGEFSTKGPRISRKAKGKGKEDEPCTPSASTDGEEYEGHDNHSEFLYHQSENSELEANPHAALMESF